MWVGQNGMGRNDGGCISTISNGRDETSCRQAEGGHRGSCRPLATAPGAGSGSVLLNAFGFGELVGILRQDRTPAQDGLPPSCRGCRGSTAPFTCVLGPVPSCIAFAWGMGRAPVPQDLAAPGLGQSVARWLASCIASSTRLALTAAVARPGSKAIAKGEEAAEESGQRPCIRSSFCCMNMVPACFPCSLFPSEQAF